MQSFLHVLATPCSSACMFIKIEDTHTHTGSDTLTQPDNDTLTQPKTVRG